MKASEIRDLSNEDLGKRLLEKREVIRAFRFQMATGNVENVRGSRNARRDIARILTVLTERNRAKAGEAK